MSAPTAGLISAALRNAVVDGTATPAAITDIPIAGKTGTVRLAHETLDWFLGFAPAVHPVVAVALLITDRHGGYGGTVAAPVAARFLEALLQP